MKLLSTLVVSVLACSVHVASASEAAAQRLAAGVAETSAVPIRPLGDCMIAKDVREWGVLNDRHLVVRAYGERYFDVQLKERCPAMARSPYIVFHDGFDGTPLGSSRVGTQTAGGSIAVDGRICGDLGDSLLAQGGVRNGSEVPCRIDSITRIDKRAYEDAFETGSVQLDGPTNIGDQALGSR